MILEHIEAESNPHRFKALFLDVGLAQRIMGADIRPWLLNPAATIGNAGAVTEAFVGQELLAPRSGLAIRHPVVRSA